MKKAITLTILFLVTFYSVDAQVGIGITLPSPSAQLDVTSNDRGVLIPRVALTDSSDATTIVNGNVESLLVYNTSMVSDIVPGYYYWDGLKWVRVITSEDSLADTNTTNVSLTEDGTNLILTDSDGNTVQIPLVDIQSPEPWYGTGGTLLDTTDDQGATTNVEDVYQLGNVGIGSIPFPGVALSVATDNTEDIIFSRFQQAPTDDVDLDFVKGYGSKAAPAPLTGNDDRLGGVRFRAMVNADPAAVAANPLGAIPPIAEFYARMDGAATTTSTPGRLVLATTAIGSTNPQDRMVVKNDGNIGIGVNADNPTEILDITNGNLRIRDINLNTGMLTDNIVVADSGGVLKTIAASGLGTTDTNTTNVSLTEDGTNLILTDSDSNTVQVPLLDIQAPEPWYGINGTLLDTTDDQGATTNAEDVYQLGNVGIGSIPFPGVALSVATDSTEDIIFSRFQQAPTDDVDLDFVKGYGSKLAPAPLTGNNDRLGGVRFRAMVNANPAAIAANPLGAIPPVAEFYAKMDGAATTASTPGQLAFATTAVGSTNPQDRMVIRNDGNIGIGTMTPTEKLEVNGTIKATSINFTGLPTFPDDAAAGVGGLVTGDCYKTATGELRIKL